MTSSQNPALARLIQVAEDPVSYITAWKARTGRLALGILPMNVPVELVHASGALPAMVQERPDPITFGNALVTEFHCGFTRSIADQAAKNQFAHLDALILVDHCIQLLGAIDVVRYEQPQTEIVFGQFTSAMLEKGAISQVGGKIGFLAGELERLTHAPINDVALSNSIAIGNENRRLLRALLDRRRRGETALTSADFRAIVAAGMVMDKAEHTGLLQALIDDRRTAASTTADVRLHLSGHFCHAPRAALLDLIEDCGTVIVDDDLYYGSRFVASDVRTDLPPMEALATWYFDRNIRTPCPTRAQNDADWEAYLPERIAANGAEGVIVLMAKFCEPHMLHYPELRKALEAQGVPHVLLETEHEGLPEETIRTRIEAMLERIRRMRTQAA